MKKLISDKLFRMLYQAKHHPELLVGRKSLIALENYISGYVDACRQYDPESFTVRWYEAFCDYIAQVCGINSKYFSVSRAVESAGYNDFDGLSFFMELFEKFFKEHCDNMQEQEIWGSIKNGEIRAFRLDKTCVMDWFSKYVHEHCTELFGVSSGTERYTWHYSWNLEQILTCTLCGNDQDVVAISQDNTEVANKIKLLPVFSAGEKVKYTIIYST